jgi:hypothetical protein
MNAQPADVSLPNNPLALEPPSMGLEDRVAHHAPADAEFDYEPVPPRKTIVVPVRCRIRGRGQPLPYAFDEKSCE